MIFIVLFIFEQSNDMNHENFLIDQEILLLYYCERIAIILDVDKHNDSRNLCPR